jgi:hypothetical protein
MSKIKVGDNLNIKFAGMVYNVTLLGIEHKKQNSIERIVYKCIGEDGTIYPVTKDKIV